MDANGHHRGAGRVRLVLRHFVFSVHKAIRIVLTLIIWLFLADFSLQFVHAYRNGKSLPERVHALTMVVQNPLEEVAQIDIRYRIRDLVVDFMPLVIFAGVFYIRFQMGSIYRSIESAIMGPEQDVQQSRSSSRPLQLAQVHRTQSYP